MTAPPLIDTSRRGLPQIESENKKGIHQDLITESLPNGMFWLRLDNENLILAYLLGRIRHSFIRILPVDKVKMEISSYDSTCDV